MVIPISPGIHCSDLTTIRGSLKLDNKQFVLFFAFEQCWTLVGQSKTEMCTGMFSFNSYRAVPVQRRNAARQGS
jgi:hypothetical protein